MKWLVMLSLVAFSCIDENRPSRTNEQVDLKHVNTLNEESPSNYCNMLSNEVFDYLTGTNSFYLGDRGSVSFLKRFNYESESWVEGNVVINGGIGSNRLEGTWRILGNNQIFLDEIIVTGGMFDASRNKGSYGTLKINCDGDLSGFLTDGSGKRVDIRLRKR